MPLPTEGSFPLLGYSRPGEAVHSKPKKAFFVRMSPEALQALHDFPNNPPMEFEFGDKPRIHIGDQHFNINPLEEPSPHDLYLRASSATKKNPPFKLHANIIGRFTVQRELVPSVGERVRESTSEAMAQRANRTTVRIEDPKALITETQRQKQAARQSQKKKKADIGSVGGSSSSRPSGTSLLSQARNKAVASAERTGTVKTTSNPLDRLSPEKAYELKRRLIHFLAPEDRAEEEVIRRIGGANIASQSRHAISHLLREVGEPVGKPGSKYCLKAEAWKEVRPYEWDGWSESVRMDICRKARKVLESLGVREGDPIWAHFVNRRHTTNNGSALSPSHYSSAQAAGRRGTPGPKRPLMSSDYREKEKGVGRARGKVEIMAKDESRTALRSGRESPIEISRVASSSSSSTLPSRGQAGTGYKAPSSKLSHDITRDTTPSRKTDMRPPVTTGRDSPSASSVRSDSHTSRVRNKGRTEPGQDSDSERRRASQAHQSSKLSQRMKVEDDYQDSDMDRRSQQRRAERERERRKELEWERKEKEKEQREVEREKQKERERRDRERGRENVRESGRERDRDERDSRHWEKDRANGRDRNGERDKTSRLKDLKKEREEGEASDASNTSVLKRRARAVDDDDDYQPSKSQKRRKTEPVPTGLPQKPKVPTSPESYHQRSYSRQSNLSNFSDLKYNRHEPSPPSLGTSSNKRARSPAPSASNKRVAISVSRDRDADSRSGSLKPKKSYKQANSDMIYTDSSDSDTDRRHKDELPQPRTTSTVIHRRNNPSIGTNPDLPIHPAKLAPSNHEPSTTRDTLTPLQPNGTGRISTYNNTSRTHERLATLQREYEKKFYPYDELWRKIDSHQRKVKGLLKRIRSGVDSVSEDDDAIMDLGELERGLANLRRMADELIPLDKEIRRLKDLCANEGSSD
ncbi:hypothetical protein NMY22_g14141 [Coprinellus aureogranulatus]|nr:hypothetical protein NMY22_g14141 [Coprinellus aureogranulatus]